MDTGLSLGLPETSASPQSAVKFFFFLFGRGCGQFAGKPLWLDTRQHLAVPGPCWQGHTAPTSWLSVRSQGDAGVGGEPGEGRGEGLEQVPREALPPLPSGPVRQTLELTDSGASQESQERNTQHPSGCLAQEPTHFPKEAPPPGLSQPPTAQGTALS